MPILEMAPETELDAVNTMLASIGQSPINTLQDEGLIDASICHGILHKTNRAVQTIGWFFNREEGVKLTPDSNQRIAIPRNAMSINPSARYHNFTQRRDPDDKTLYMYDLDNHTFKMPNSGAIQFDLVYFFPFEDIPQAARSYIAVRAGRVFQQGFMGDELLFRFERQDEVQALYALKKENTRTNRANILRPSNATNSIYQRRNFIT